MIALKHRCRMDSIPKTTSEGVVLLLAEMYLVKKVKGDCQLDNQMIQGVRVFKPYHLSP
jgi:hypothetical protein